MKKLLICIIISALFLASCNGATSPDTTADTTAQMDPATTTSADTTKEEAFVFFKIEEVEGGYSYALYNADGSIAEEMPFLEEKPEITVIEEKLIRVDEGEATYYYDLDGRRFSESFTHVFHEAGTLFVSADGERVIVRDIFDPDGVYKEFSDFTGALCTSVEMPILSARFVEDGSAVMIEYLSGEEGEKFCDCFNTGSGSKFSLIEDWKNKKELITPDEKQAVEDYLYAYAGRVEPNTGFEYSYNVTGALEINGVRYLYCECDLLIVGEDGAVTETLVAEFVLSEARDQRYDCRAKDDGELIVYTETNMI